MSEETKPARPSALRFLLVLIPLMAWWFGVGLWEATLMEAGLLLFFLVYTYAFNWAFDRVFGLPASAQALPQTAAA